MHLHLPYPWDKRERGYNTAKFFCCFNSSNYSSGAKPIFVDVLEDQNLDFSKMKNSNKKTKAIMPVHLTGRPCEMKEIMKIAKI